MVWLEIEGYKIKQYASGRMPNGAKINFSGKIEEDLLRDLIGQAVFVRVKFNDEVYKFVTKVKQLKTRKYIIPYVSSKKLRDLVGETINADIIGPF